MRKILGEEKISSLMIFLLEKIDILVTKNFVTMTFSDRDYVVNAISSPYVLGDKIRHFVTKNSITISDGARI